MPLASRPMAWQYMAEGFVQLGNTITLGLAQELDQALPVGGRHVIVIGCATETDVAVSFRAIHQRLITPATETDLARAIARTKKRTLGQSHELDEAIGLGISGVYHVNLAFETDTALPIRAYRARKIGRATEHDQALHFMLLIDNIDQVTFPELLLAVGDEPAVLVSVESADTPNLLGVGG